MDAHGAANAQQMLPVFESYLEKKGLDDEERYDRVRQGAVVFLGTLARHMEPGGTKVATQHALSAKTRSRILVWVTEGCRLTTLSHSLPAGAGRYHILL